MNIKDVYYKYPFVAVQFTEEDRDDVINYLDDGPMCVIPVSDRVIEVHADNEMYKVGYGDWVILASTFDEEATSVSTVCMDIEFKRDFTEV